MSSEMVEEMRRVRNEARVFLEPIQNDPQLPLSQIQECLRRYACHLLSADPDLQGDSIKKVSLSGIDNLAAKYGLEAVSDVSKSCSGASSTNTRIFLMVIALSRDLELEMDPSESRKITTFSQLSCYVQQLLAGKRSECIRKSDE